MHGETVKFTKMKVLKEIRYNGTAGGKYIYHCVLKCYFSVPKAFRHTSSIHFLHIPAPLFCCSAVCYPVSGMSAVCTVGVADRCGFVKRIWSATQKSLLLFLQSKSNIFNIVYAAVRR